MAKERKIICSCGKSLNREIVLFDGFKTEAMSCPNCHFVTLTKEQAREYLKLKQLHDIIDAERKIIKIGNSMGITLPDSLHTLGVKVGKRVKMKALSPRSFKIELLE